MNSNKQLMLVIAEMVSFFYWRFSGGFFLWSNEELQREIAFSAYTEQRMRKRNLEAAMSVNWPSLPRFRRTSEGAVIPGPTQGF